LPFSISQAMNASVKGLAAIPGSKQKSAVNGLAGSSKRFFDRPKPATSTGFFATTANKRTLSLVIKPKDKPWDRNRYLSGNIFGGARPPKPFEIAFAAQSKGQIPTGARFVPTGAIKQDRYGNVSKSNLRKILNSVGTGNRSGVYHYCDDRSLSWYGFAQTIFNLAVDAGLLDNVPDLTPVPSSEFPQPASRPKWSVLDTTKIGEVFNIQPASFDRSLQIVIDEIKTREMI